MSKYSPLWEHIASNNLSEMTFSEIKDVLEFDIDHSFLTYKKELMEFGFEIAKISMKDKKIFIKRRT